MNFPHVRGPMQYIGLPCIFWKCCHTIHILLQFSFFTEHYFRDYIGICSSSTCISIVILGFAYLCSTDRLFFFCFRFCFFFFLLPQILLQWAFLCKPGGVHLGGGITSREKDREKRSQGPATLPLPTASRMLSPEKSLPRLAKWGLAACELGLDFFNQCLAGETSEVWYQFALD